MVVSDLVSNRSRQTAAREHVLILNGMRPIKSKTAARKRIF